MTIKKWFCTAVAVCALLAAGCGGGKTIAGETCGNDVAEGTEECDGLDLGGGSCAGLDLGGGTLVCEPGCTYDISGCDIQPVCGNDDAQYGEECDGTDLDGFDCLDLGYSGGTLACAGNCTFDTSACEDPVECGDGVAEGNEECDGSDLDGASCQSLNLGDGNLACEDDCTYDTSDCPVQPDCGNNTAEYPEVCDGSDLNNETCVDLGLPPGTLVCRSDCTGFDTSGCSGVCGDGEINGNESCDGTNLNNMDCTDFNFTSGQLACLSDCSDFDTSGCSNIPAVIINEVLLGSPDGVELLNLSGGPVDLTSWTLEWWGYQGANPVGDVWVLPAYNLANGDRVVILDEYQGDGSPPTVDATNSIIQFHENIWWGDDVGAVALYTDDASPPPPTDFVRWTGTDFGPPAGTSWADTPDLLPSFNYDTITLSRVPDGQDTDVAGDFCMAYETMGTTNATCLQYASPGTILITEIDVSDPPNQDQVELYNPGSSAVDLLDWWLEWDPQGGGQGDFLPSYTLQPGAYVIVFDDAGGNPPYADATGIHIGNIGWQPNDNGSCSILEPGFYFGVDFLRWGANWPGADPPDTWADTPAQLGTVPPGSTLGRETLTDTNTAGDWCLMAPSLGSVNNACN